MQSTTSHTPHAPEEGRSLMSLFSDLLRETSSLVRNEAELAKVEISDKVSQVSNGLAELAIGGLIVFAGFIVTLIAIANGLAHILPPEQADWLAPLIVGVVVMVLGFVALMRGRRNVKPDSLAPERTMESLRRDAQMVKGHAS